MSILKTAKKGYQRLHTTYHIALVEFRLDAKNNGLTHVSQAEPSVICTKLNTSQRCPANIGCRPFFGRSDYPWGWPPYHPQLSRWIDIALWLWIQVTVTSIFKLAILHGGFALLSYVFVGLGCGLAFSRLLVRWFISLTLFVDENKGPRWKYNIISVNVPSRWFKFSKTLTNDRSRNPELALITFTDASNPYCMLSVALEASL